jgi:hypothetical protein
MTVMITWVPLAVLSAIEGLALRPNPRESLLLDCAAYGRYLVAAPALVLAGAIALPQLAAVVRHFLDSGIISRADRPRYEALVESTRRLLVTRRVDVVLVVLAYVLSVARSRALYPADVSTWTAPTVGGAAGHLSLAGWWRLLVSQPLFTALLAMWLWRLLLWIRFLRATASMDLRLVAAHPDRLGGLRFALIPIRGFTVLAFAIGAVTAGSVAQSVLFDGAALSSFEYLIGAQVVAVVALLAGPSLLLTAPLVRLQATGTFLYGRLASDIGHAFQQRWVAGERTADAEALSAQDFSATTDLYSVSSNVQNINPFVLDVSVLIMLVAATLLPYVPLVLAVMPMEEILRFALRAFA